MLEALAAGDVREREQEVVDVVVARGVGGAGLADEVVELGEKRGPEVGVLGQVGDDVDVVLGRDLGSESELVEVFAGDDGRVFELLDGGGVRRAGDLSPSFCMRRGCAGVSAVPMPQPWGTMTLGWIGISLTGVLAG